MNYYSDFSYLSRAIMLTYLWLYLILHIWRADRFSSLDPSRLRRFELKSVVTLMMLTFIPFQLYYDISMAYILYYEGYMCFSGMPTPTYPLLWHSSDLNLARSIDYSLMVGFSFQTGTLFLLQSFWNYLAGSVTKHCFMGSFEFKLYILWSLCSICMFPFIKFFYIRHDQEALSNTVALLAYGTSLFILGCLGILSHYRFKKLILMIEDERNGSITMSKLYFFSQANNSMVVALFSSSISFMILAGGDLIPGKPIEMSKGVADCLIFNGSFCSMAIWFLVIKIVHCPYQLGSSPSSSTSYMMPKMSTAFSDTEYYSSAINMDSGDSGLTRNPSRRPSRTLAQPTMTKFDSDYVAPIIIPPLPVGAVNPRQSTIHPIQRPVSFRQPPVSHPEVPPRPLSLHQYPSGPPRRKSKQKDVPPLYI